MDHVIEQIEWELERSDKYIHNNRIAVEDAEEGVRRAQARLDVAVKEYNAAVSFKEEAALALAVLRAHEER